MSKLITPDSLAQDDFEKRKKAFLYDVDALGKKYQISVHAVLEPQKATNADSQQEYMVYVPKINIADRKTSNPQAPEKPQEPKKKD